MMMMEFFICLLKGYFKKERLWENIISKVILHTL